MNFQRLTIFVAFVFILMTLGGPLFAQATVTEIAGKVEIKQPNGVWGVAWVGMWVPAGSTISTGFNSKAVLALDGSTLYVKQLTRLTIEEIARSQGVIKTNLYIQTGSMEADVKKGSDYTQDYKVRSPVSTAAVRGTKIKYDGSELICTEGRATLFNLLGQPTTVFMGDSSLTGDGIAILTPHMRHLKKTTVRIITRNPFETGTQITGNGGGDAIVIFVPIF